MINRYFVVLFAVFLLVCVDAKATAVNEDNLTSATRWVRAWHFKSKVMSTFAKEDVCHKEVDKNIDYFIRFSNESLRKPLSLDDVLYLRETAFYAKNIIQQNKACYSHRTDEISLLLTDIENRLKQ